MTAAHEQITILIGSPKGTERSASARLAKMTTEPLISAGWTSDWFHVHETLRSDGLWSDLLSSIARSDVVLLAVPLYVDSLPAPVIEILHRLVQQQNEVRRDELPSKLLSLLNCGFVEAYQNETAQAMVQLFCERMRFEWAGGISIGAGGMTSKRVRRALALAGEALRDDILIPDSVHALTSQPMMKPWLYVLGGNAMWRRQAKANGLDPKQLAARPDEDPGASS